MLEGVLNVSYSDAFEVDVEYGIDIDKYLKHETTQLFRVKPLKSIEPMLPVKATDAQRVCSYLLQCRLYLL